MREKAMRKGPVSAIGLSMLALTLALWLGPGASDNKADANHGVAVAIDTNTAGNSALALGTINACRTVTAGTPTDVDLVVTGLSDLASFEAYIKYDASKIQILRPGEDGQYGDSNTRFLLQQAQPSPPGNNLFNGSEVLPDAPPAGVYRVAASDLVVTPDDPDPDPVGLTHMSGVLVRLQINGTASGFSLLQITPIQAQVGTVGANLVSSTGVNVGDGGDADVFIDNVTNGGIIVGSGSCTPDADGDIIPDAFDNCPNISNIDQANFDGDSQGDVCDTDDDNDGLLDTNEPATCTAPPPSHAGRLDPDCDDDFVSDGSLDPDGVGGPIVAGPDNCISVANTDQLNTDGDAQGNACDTDDDNDGVLDTPDNCPVNANASQANYDLSWGDTQGGDACDPEADGDGYTNAVEAHIGTLSLDHCGNQVTIPGNIFPTSSAWPADLRSETGSLNKVNITDLGTFIIPIRRINTSPGVDANFHVRWDLVPGPISPTGKHINVQDLSALTINYPLMFGGVRAFGGPTCTPP